MEQPPSPTSAAAPVRAGLHARRAAAARRRALLTVTLLVLTAGTGALAAGTSVSSWFVLAPAVLLGAVLALGRRAVRAHARADAAWEGRERVRRAAAAAPTDVRLAGRPAPAIRPQVTGRAVKSSQSHTQMIARVRPAAAVTAAASSAEGATVADDRPALAEVASASTASSAVEEATVVLAEADGAVVTAGTSFDRGVDTAADKADTSADEATGAAEWTSVPVPRPVYTMKSAAPRWEPAPLTAEMAQITQARRAELAAGDSAPVEETAGDASSATSEAEAPSDSLGVNLNSVLARRRAAGE
ncbi:hypothetical protein SAMN05216410_2439 [Sanguibacter gelidistatuariae]|uniref:Uncharacterized protein n=1 Tax=Sanguibacter gelidistatuariae TaxID=1814289 RepID=A0A1G6Q465_9MICO|nr:hypothetical protein [Sanguibacter gelidistatuariae]SDC87250.1 hypothetical protein SAMN05216410_2439 [Sanguibacter gelidistatuariae]